MIKGDLVETNKQCDVCGSPIEDLIILEIRGRVGTFTRHVCSYECSREALGDVFVERGLIHRWQKKHGGDEL